MKIINLFYKFIENKKIKKKKHEENWTWKDFKKHNILEKWIEKSYKKERRML